MYPALQLFFDGLCEPMNPGGVATYGFIAYDRRKKVQEGCGLIGAGMLGDNVSNNVAEYTGIIKGMECLLASGYHGKLDVRGDSQLAIRQLLGLYAVRAPRLIPLHNRVLELKKEFKSVAFEWVPRDLNEAADALSRRAFDEFLAKNLQDYLEFYRRPGK
jgi:ribonuclease HI